MNFMGNLFDSDPFITPDPKPGNLMSPDRLRHNAQHEDRVQARRLHQKLSQFSPQKIVGADGKVYYALAYNAGGEPEEVATALVTPFLLSVNNSGAPPTWSVSSLYSSVTDGVNGDAIDLAVPAGTDWSVGAIKFDVDTVIAATKYIVLEADVDSELVVTDWTLAAVDLADAMEVRTNGGTPDIQDKVRLLIGKVTVDAGAATVGQAVFTAQELTYKFINGMMVRGFVAAPVHPDYL